MKKITLLVLLAVICFGLAGCSKDAEINAFLTEWETVTNDMSKNLEEGNVDEARKVFDGKKDSLKTKWDSVKTARGYQVSGETQKKMEESAKKNMDTLTNAVMKGSSKMRDRAAGEKMQALMKEYGEVFKM